MYRRRINTTPRSDRAYFRLTANWTRLVNTSRYTPRGGIRL